MPRIVRIKMPIKNKKNIIERIYYKNVSIARSISEKADISPDQIKAARALLGWSQADLAEKAGYSIPAINNIEKGTYEARSNTVADVIQTFEENNLEFIDGGVRIPGENLRIKCYEGEEAFTQLFKKLVRAFENEDGELLLSGVDENYLMLNYRTMTKKFQDRLNQNPNAKVRILCHRKQSAGLMFKNFEKRIVPDDIPLIPVILYRKRVVSIIFEAPAQVIMIYTPTLYRHYVDWFNYLWEQTGRYK